jgi:hypothetical protein
LYKDLKFLFFIKGLTWLFGFILLIPAPKDFLYLSFILALIFCILNSMQGVFIFIVSIWYKRLELNDVKKNTKSKYYVNGDSTNSTNLTSLTSYKQNDNFHKF